jgi:hypothetical protein
MTAYGVIGAKGQSILLMVVNLSDGSPKVGYGVTVERSGGAVPEGQAGGANVAESARAYLGRT